MESGKVVWTGSGTILPHDLKGCNLELVTCPQHEPVMGPLLFVLYINDLLQCLENCSINMYADDTVMHFTHLCTSEIARVVQDDLNRAVQLMESSTLILNQSKTKSMLFGS